MRISAWIKEHIPVYSANNPVTSTLSLLKTRIFFSTGFSFLTGFLYFGSRWITLWTSLPVCALHNALPSMLPYHRSDAHEKMVELSIYCCRFGRVSLNKKVLKSPSMNTGWFAFVRLLLKHFAVCSAALLLLGDTKYLRIQLNACLCGWGNRQ